LILLCFWFFCFFFYKEGGCWFGCCVVLGCVWCFVFVFVGGGGGVGEGALTLCIGPLIMYDVLCSGAK